jgi:hypothetical protein
MMDDQNLFVSCMFFAAFLGACAGYFFGVRERDMIHVEPTEDGRHPL